MALSSAIRTENIWQFEDAVAHGVALAKVKCTGEYDFTDAMCSGMMEEGEEVEKDKGEEESEGISVKISDEKTRRAGSWRNGGLKDSIVWSNSHGVCDCGKCRCDGGWSGDACQYPKTCDLTKKQSNQMCKNSQDIICSNADQGCFEFIPWHQIEPNFSNLMGVSDALDVKAIAEYSDSKIFVPVTVAGVSVIIQMEMDSFMATESVTVETVTARLVGMEINANSSATSPPGRASKDAHLQMAESAVTEGFVCVVNVLAMMLTRLETGGIFMGTPVSVMKGTARLSMTDILMTSVLDTPKEIEVYHVAHGDHIRKKTLHKTAAFICGSISGLCAVVGGTVFTVPPQEWGQSNAKGKDQRLFPFQGTLFLVKPMILILEWGWKIQNDYIIVIIQGHLVPAYQNDENTKQEISSVEEECSGMDGTTFVLD
eukprot:bmy_01386T0